ncbi:MULTISPECIES: sulfatase-like hydrolase/transferase [Carboxylicivirga]|uniref:sulfatase-like hydrolase/transferase n=1 Tax=Carboxylicivirga TaxID=1628153 RepID=UPI0011780ED3|nr:sulfatase-like hydrolase/transferase [Carboxylicivirga sp. M1479]TRX71287.1 sulfatase-like hydrolase/transferase [Carboxylicivirga sp. M1479]
MKRIILSRLFIFTISILIQVAFSIVNAKEKSNQPNFIIILADDLGYGDVGFTGSTQIKTPHIDRLASDGVIFEQGYVSSAVCAPSRAGLMTGRNQVNFGFDNNLPVSTLPQYKKENSGLPLNEKTIANRLEDLGYVTGLIGKWHLGDQEHFHPTKRGFQEVWTYPVGGHDYFKSKPDGRGYLAPLESNYKEPQAITYLTDDKGDECVDFIKRHKDEPFFLYASFNAPHTPMQATEDDIELYLHVENKKRRTYCAMVHRLDVNIGRIVKELEKNKIYDNTVIVFLSDNGGPCDSNASINAPYRGQKGILLEGGVRVPYTIKFTKSDPSGITFKEPVTSLDLTPTFVSMAGGEITEADELDGINLLPYVSGDIANAPHDDLKWRFTISATMREGDWKLIRLPDRLPMLYNLKEDPSELNDLAAQHPERVISMLKKLGDWDVTRPHEWFKEGPNWRKNQISKYDKDYKLVQPKK